MSSSFDEVVAAVQRERQYQDAKWGTIEENPHDLSGWLVILRVQARASQYAIEESVILREILHMVSVGVACLEQHGIIERKAPDGK